MFSKDTVHLWVLAVLLLCATIGFGVVRAAVVPDSYYQFGRYRGAAIEEIASRKRTIPAAAECLECHAKEKAQFEAEQPHRQVHCMSCHGSAAEHVDNCWAARRSAEKAGTPLDEIKCEPKAEEVKDLKSACMTCHMQMVGRAEEHAQIIWKEHAEENEPDEPDNLRVCMECHMAHNPLDEGEGEGEGEGEAKGDDVVGQADDDDVDDGDNDD